YRCRDSSRAAEADSVAGHRGNCICDGCCGLRVQNGGPMDKGINVALLQLNSAGIDVASNAEIGQRYGRIASDPGADVALFPEMWRIGYTKFPADDEGQKLWRALATPLDGRFITGFQDLARELDMGIVITYLGVGHDLPRNSASVIDRHGSVVLTYSKVHTCDFDGGDVMCEPGEEFSVATLDTAIGPVKAGVMICYDREFPESARTLMLHGAELILTPNASTLEDSRLSQFRARAFENMVGVAMANYPMPHRNGNSVAFDAVAF